MVQGAQLIGHRRGRVGRAASMNSEMGQHVGGSSLRFRCVWSDYRKAREGLAWIEARAAEAVALSLDQGQRAVKARSRCDSVVVEGLFAINATIASSRALGKAGRGSEE